MIDRGRQAVYDAEDAVFTGSVFDTVLTFPDAAEFGSVVCTSSWWQRHVAATPSFTVARADAHTSRAFGTREVRLAPIGCRPHVVVHELAHVAATTLTGIRHGHDRIFRGIEIEVCRVVFGADVADRLSSRFGSVGLEVVAPAVVADAAVIDAVPVWATWWADRQRVHLTRPDTGFGAPIAL